MNRAGHNDVNFFVGNEVEHTPAYGMKTLFVVGLQSAEMIDRYIDNNPFGIEHVYFGANQSFDHLEINDSYNWMRWESMLGYWLRRGSMCTLDIPVSSVEGLLESGLCDHSSFIPMISVRLPYIKQLGYNATIKLDDKDFAATNPGVWCHNLHTLQNRELFTPWSRYTKDEVIK
jgi:hypothetical protein